MKSAPETLDGIPVDRRPELNILDKDARARFIADLKARKLTPDDVKFIVPELTDPSPEAKMAQVQEVAAVTAELREVLRELGGKRHRKQTAKKARPRWRQ